jgi:hypothetical protein
LVMLYIDRHFDLGGKLSALALPNLAAHRTRRRCPAAPSRPSPTQSWVHGSIAGDIRPTSS